MQRIVSLMLVSIIGLMSPFGYTYEPLGLIAPVPTVSFRSEGIRGITIAPIEDSQLRPEGYGSLMCDVAVEEVAQLGGTWISITPFGRMDDLDSVDIQHYFEIPVEENENLIRRTAAAAKARGLRVALIPHVYVMSGKWRGEIDPGSEEAWATWFEAYSNFVLRFARLAEELQVDLFSIGVEFKSSTNYRPNQWRRVIEEIRAVYRGPLTYSANWDEADQVLFWEELDVIGINAFWPLASNPGDEYEQMRQRAEIVATDLESLHFHYDKPIVFTEMGVKSATDSALAPWEWPEHCSSLEYDEFYQAAAYDAVFDVMTEKPWFWGLFIWKYFSDPFDETQESITGFSPRLKQAESRLVHHFDRYWYL